MIIAPPFYIPPTPSPGTVAYATVFNEERGERMNE